METGLRPFARYCAPFCDFADLQQDARLAYLQSETWDDFIIAIKRRASTIRRKAGEVKKGRPIVRTAKDADRQDFASTADSLSTEERWRSFGQEDRTDLVAGTNIEDAVPLLAGLPFDVMLIIDMEFDEMPGDGKVRKTIRERLADATGCEQAYDLLREALT